MIICPGRRGDRAIHVVFAVADPAAVREGALAGADNVLPVARAALEGVVPGFLEERIARLRKSRCGEQQRGTEAPGGYEDREGKTSHAPGMWKRDAMETIWTQMQQTIGNGRYRIGTKRGVWRDEGGAARTNGNRMGETIRVADNDPQE